MEPVWGLERQGYHFAFSVLPHPTLIRPNVQPHIFLSVNYEICNFSYYDYYLFLLILQKYSHIHKKMVMKM